jgi:F-type H+-transporting ATPase subunit epsilon
MKEFHLIVSSPDGHVLDDAATRLIVCGTEGELAVMAGHAPFVTSVVACDCKVGLADDTDRIAHTDGGLLSVAHDRVTLLSGSFHWLE